jgi:hypothetical protein
MTPAANTASPVFDMKGAPPPEIAAKFGNAKSWEDIVKAYANSSGEARRIAEEKKRIEQENQTLKTVGDLFKQNQSKPKDTTFFGYPSEAAYLAEKEVDPVGASRKALLHSLKSDPTALEDILSPILDKRLGKYESHLGMTQERARMSQAFEKLPEFAKGGEMRQHLDTWYDEGGKEVVEAIAPALRETGHNAYEILAKSAGYDALKNQNAILKAENEALKNGKQQQAIRASGGQSTGTPNAPAPKGTKEELVALAKVKGIPVEEGEAEIFANALDEASGKNIRTQRRR